MAANTYSGFCEFVPQVCGQFVYMLFSLFFRSCYTLVLYHIHIFYIHTLYIIFTLLVWIISLFYLIVDVLCSRQYHSSWSPLSEQLSSLYKRKREKYIIRKTHQNWHGTMWPQLSYCFSSTFAYRQQYIYVICPRSD